MNNNEAEILARLAKLPPEERQRILDAFLRSALVVNGASSGKCEISALQADNQKQLDISNMEEKLASHANFVEAEVVNNADIKRIPGQEDGMVEADQQDIVGNNQELAGLLAAGTGVAAGLLGMALDSRALKQIGAVGTVVGGLLFLQQLKKE